MRYRIVIFLLLVAVSHACAQQRRAILNIPDPLEALGVGTTTRVELTNRTVLYGTVFSMGDTVGDFGPGATLASHEHKVLRQSFAVVVANFYDSPTKEHLIGVAAKTISVRRGEVSSVYFGYSDIRRLDGGNFRRDAYPTPPLGESREVEIPTIGNESATWGAIVNATLFDILLTIDGEPRTIPPGGHHWIRCTNTVDVRRDVILRFKCLDPGFRDARERRFHPTSGYPSAFVHVVDVNWFSRY
jgi:hypothetical protein